MEKPYFVKSTLIFAAVGIFIPAITVIVLLECHRALSSVGFECHNAWTVLWSFTILCGLLLPILFYRHLINLKKKKDHNLHARLIFFNLIEYILIQASLAPIFTSGQKLCYMSDGQNGLELVLTAWLALPVLIVLSSVFEQALKTENK